MKLLISFPKENENISSAARAIEAIIRSRLVALNSSHRRSLAESHQIGLNEGMISLLFVMLSALSFSQTYHRYGTLENDLRLLEKTYPTVASVSVAGTSVEGRNLSVITLSRNKTAPALFIVGGIHARERIASELPFLVAKKLLETNSSLLDTHTVHILPIMNPDGVEYDYSGAGKMSWRKNRRSLGGGAFGVDLNRNFGFGWSNEGASDAPFSDVYKGTAPFSEPETRAVRDFINSHPEIKIVVNYHSFGEQVFFPWGSKYSPIKDEAKLKRHQLIAETVAKLTSYTPMQASAPGLVTGDICDWTFGEKGITCLGIELDPREHIHYGHYLPENEIENVFRRNWESILYLVTEAKNVP